MRLNPLNFLLVILLSITAVLSYSNTCGVGTAYMCTTKHEKKSLDQSGYKVDCRGNYTVIYMPKNQKPTYGNICLEKIKKDWIIYWKNGKRCNLTNYVEIQAFDTKADADRFVQGIKQHGLVSVVAGPGQNACL